MAARKLKAFLDREGVSYDVISHACTYTAPETAASSHVSGRNFAKTVIVVTRDEMEMVVLPANRKIVLSDLQDLLADRNLRLATETEFIERFPDCEPGAMPPFGNLYDLPVYVAQCLAEEPAIAFNAGTHRETIKMSFRDYAELVQPTILDFATA
jgi:Ala-tRNA(Pro) deacylase